MSMGTVHFGKKPVMKPESCFQERGRKYWFQVLRRVVNKVQHFRLLFSLTGWAATSRHWFCWRVIICREVVLETRCAVGMASAGVRWSGVTVETCLRTSKQHLPALLSSPPSVTGRSARRWWRENEWSLFSFHTFTPHMSRYCPDIKLSLQTHTRDSRLLSRVGKWGGVVPQKKWRGDRARRKEGWRVP